MTDIDEDAAPGGRGAAPTGPDAELVAVDANERFAERLAREIEGVLGVGIALEAISLEGDMPVRIRATCLVDGQLRELAGTGPTIIEASRDLIRAAAELRLSAAWWRLVGPV